MATDPWLIRIHSGVEGMTPERYPELVEQFGRYLVRYEPRRAKHGEQWIWTSEDINEAKTFDDPVALHAFYAQAVGIRPWDGKPDRPLTAFNITVARRSQFEQDEAEAWDARVDAAVADEDARETTP